jgi:hypothetical protein
MGYTTEFWNTFKLNKTLDKDMHTFLTKLSETRRMARKLPSEYGVEGELYVDDAREETVIDHNRPPNTQPGLWCGWIPTEDGTAIEWNGAEKFYHSTEWLAYLIQILKAQGYILHGDVGYRGEQTDDVGVIRVKNNRITTYTFQEMLDEMDDRG